MKYLILIGLLILAIGCTHETEEGYSANIMGIVQEAWWSGCYSGCMRSYPVESLNISEEINPYSVISDKCYEVCE